jgi:hypothetical protein
LTRFRSLSYADVCWPLAITRVRTNAKEGSMRRVCSSTTGLCEISHSFEMKSQIVIEQALARAEDASID